MYITAGTILQKGSKLEQDLDTQIIGYLKQDPNKHKPVNMLNRNIKLF